MRAEKWNSAWKFWEEVDAFALVWNIPDQAVEVELPHDAMLLRPARPDSPNGGDTGYRDGGSFVYVKEFFAPEEYREQTVSLQFDGIYMNALVYLNGQLVGTRPYGYSQFCVCLNDYLNYGGQNELRVLVKNGAMPNSRWYSGSGIYRDVWLLTGGTAFIAPEGLTVSTRDVSGDSASLTITAALKNRGALPRDAQLELSVLDQNGETAAEVCLPIVLTAGREDQISQTVTVDSPALWSAESPSMYRCVARLTEHGRELDRASVSFGIRTLQLDPRHGLRVNGVPVKLRGACIHHDNGLLGAVSLAEAELRRVRILKEAGFNAVRMAHNPASPLLLDACDRLGMYVMDEAFDMWTRPKKDCDYSLFFGRWWHDDVTALVRKDFNHPSVILYSLGNEIPEVGMAQGSAQSRDMANLVKSLDPTRFVMVSVNGVFACGDRLDGILADILSASPEGTGGGNVNNFMAVMDTHMDEIVRHPVVSRRLSAAEGCMDLMGYNYMAARYEQDAVQYPNRVIVGSETYPPEIARNWPLVLRLPSVIGDFTWTGWDYIGEAGVGIPAYRFGEGGFGAQFPCQLAFCGDIDITGFRRPASYFRQIVFGLRSDPYITVQDPAHFGQQLIKTPWVISDSCSSWTWHGHEEAPVVVEVYSPGSEVELFQDGISLGRRPAGQAAGFTALFETVYRPGTLVAVAYDGQRELGRMELSSADTAACLRLDAESAGELVYVDITLTDSQGRVVTDCDISLTARASGCALMGFGSGDPKPIHNYTESVTDTFRGRAQAILRRTGSAPVLTVTGGGFTGSVALSDL